MSKDPFTLDLFNTTAFSGGAFQVTAFPDAVETQRQERGPDETDPAPVAQPAAAGADDRAENFYLEKDRGLARSWKARARDNLDAIRLAGLLQDEDRPATPEQQAKLAKFTGFGASDLANTCFRRPGDEGFRKGWEQIGADLEGAVDKGDHASLARCTQYAHFTPEYIVRAIWAGLSQLGFRGGRVLEPGIGTGLFPSMIPEALRDLCHITGIELDPVTARIAGLLLPRSSIINRDFARVDLAQHFDLAIGNPPFATPPDRSLRSIERDTEIGRRRFRAGRELMCRSVVRLLSLRIHPFHEPCRDGVMPVFPSGLRA